ncbi:MAG: hypothetical protein IJL31_00210 [Oscillospiraceae bacterium]|nr:hypothetical protein [Bacillota bacterium]MBQ6029910.1 hypothetical protein [Oscillospiraceae bacterium]MBQ6243221.1 hypothetical protein [Bacteroidales bacterium]
MKKLTKDTFKPEDFTFVDLGLPSGRLWANENAPGHYTHDEAEQAFGEFLPKGSAMAELIEECKIEWNYKEHGLDITGPNGNSIFLPASGYIFPGKRSVYADDEIGYYWTRMRYVPNSESFAGNSQTSARRLSFRSGGVYPLNYTDRSYGFSVRPCREFV